MTTQQLPKCNQAGSDIREQYHFKALQAWSLVGKVLTNLCICNKELRFSDELITTVIEAMGGWSTFQVLPDEEISLYAIAFQKRYVKLLSQSLNTPINYCCALTQSLGVRNGGAIQPRLVLSNLEQTERAIEFKIPVCLHFTEVNALKNEEQTPMNSLNRRH